MRVPTGPGTDPAIPPEGLAIPHELTDWGTAERALGRLDQALDDEAGRARWLLQARRLDVAQGQAMEGRLVTAEDLARRLCDPAWSPGREQWIDQAHDIWRALTSATAATHPLSPAAATLQELAKRATLSLWIREGPPADLFPDGRAGLERLTERWALLPPGGLTAAGEALRILYEDRPFGRFTGRLARVLAPLIGRRFARSRHPCLFLGRALARRHQALEEALEAGQGAWTRLFLSAAQEAAEDGLQLKIDLDHAQRSLLARCAGARTSSRLPQAVTFFFEQPVFQAEDLAKRLKVTRAGASRLIGQLRQNRAIDEISNRKRYRLYCARSVIDARAR